MSLNCLDGVSIPELSSEECQGVYFSTNCVVNPTAIVALNLPANSLLSAVINALVSVNISNRALIDSLTARVEALEG